MSMKSLMKTSAGWGMTALRIPVGIVFMGHGLQKLGYLGGNGMEGFTGFIESLGLPAPVLMAWLAALSETVGGALIVIGLFTRGAAFTTAITMFVAIFWVHFDNGLLGSGGYQWALVLFAASVALLLDGAGKASVDGALSK